MGGCVASGSYLGGGPYKALEVRQTLLDIGLDVRYSCRCSLRGAARPAQRRQRRPRLLTTADSHGAQTGTLLLWALWSKHAQRPLALSASPGKSRDLLCCALVLLLDVPTTGLWGQEYGPLGRYTNEYRPP